MLRYLKDLMDVGLTENEAKVYCCLIRKDSFTATEISQCSKVNRSKVYTVLSNLMQKGLVIEKLTNVKKFSAIQPDIAFNKLISIQQERLRQLNELTQKLTPIYNEKQEGSPPLDFIEVFTTPCSIINKHHALELNSQNSVLSFCKKPYAMSRSLNVHDVQKKTMAKGVTFRSIYEAEWDDLEFFCKSMENFVNAGEKIRISLKLPIKLHIFDNKAVMFSMQNQIDPKSNLTYLVIEHSNMSDMLITTFNTYWNSAFTVEEFKKKYFKSFEK